MSWHVLTYPDMSWHVLVYPDMSWHVLVYHDMSLYITTCPDMYLYIPTCPDMSLYITTCPDMSGHFLIGQCSVRSGQGVIPSHSSHESSAWHEERVLPSQLYSARCRNLPEFKTLSRIRPRRTRYCWAHERRDAEEASHGAGITRSLQLFLVENYGLCWRALLLQQRGK